MCFACDSTDHLAGNLKYPKLAPKSRAAIQDRAEFSDNNKGALNLRRKQLRELQQLRNEKKAHFRLLGAHANEEEMEDQEDNYEDEDEGDEFAAGAVKSHKCFGV